jgi:hypothetical protein
LSNIDASSALPCSMFCSRTWASNWYIACPYITSSHRMSKRGTLEFPSDCFTVESLELLKRYDFRRTMGLERS